MPDSSRPQTSVAILGYFPPPFTGQAISTERLYQLLLSSTSVARLPIAFQHGESVSATTRLRVSAVSHLLHQRRQVAQFFGRTNPSHVLWTSVSAATRGHVRDLLAVMPAIPPQTQLIAVIHWGNFDRLFSSRITRLTVSRLLERVDRFVFLSELLAEKCRRWIPEQKIATIPNTIDRDVICSETELAAKREARKEGRRLHVLFLSNMIRTKGYDDVLAAARLARIENRNTQFDFVGGWESVADESDFGDTVGRNQLENMVLHHGPVRDRTAIRKLLLQADVFVLPTYYPTEAQPLTIIEALNAGTPVVTTAHAGIPEMVTDGQEGILVPPRSPEAILNALQVMHDPVRWTAFSIAARRKYEQHYSPDVVRAIWLSLLEEKSLDGGSTANEPRSAQDS